MNSNSEYQFYIFVDLRNKMIPAEREANAQYGIDKSLYQAWLKSPHSMEEFLTHVKNGITYFLFGELAVQAYEHREGLSCYLQEISKKSHAVFAYNPIVDPPETLLEKFSGWADYCKIFKEEYYELKKK